MRVLGTFAKQCKELALLDASFNNGYIYIYIYISCISFMNDTCLPCTYVSFLLNALIIKIIIFTGMY